MPINRFTRIHLLIFLFLCIINLNLSSQSSKVARIIVKAGDHVRFQTLVSIPLTDIPVTDGESFLLKSELGSGEKYIPCQVEEGTSKKLWWIIPDTIYPGDKAIFILSSGPPKEWPVLKIVRDDKKLLVVDKDQPVLQYNYAPVSPPEGIDSSYTRSAFIHPVWAPNGDTLSRIQPPDHYHHYGIWNPWTKTQFEGREVDFWNLGSKKGTVRFKSFLTSFSGPAVSGFVSSHDHVDLTAPEGEKVAMHENWDVKVWNMNGKGKKKSWLWDLSTTLQCATSEPVMLDQYRYGGGIGFRATGAWTDQNSNFLTSEGKTRMDGDGTRARWCMIHGEGSNGLSGILFMSHPENRDHPEPMRIWPVSNRDVFFQFCPIRHRGWKLLPGNQYLLNYRMLVYSGIITPETAERYWQDYANPPEVKVEPIK